MVENYSIGMNAPDIAFAAQLVRQAQRIVTLTGAGISVPSGIPDFRSDTGLWQQENPMDVASLRGFTANPKRFYDWFRPLLSKVQAAKPNPAHHAFAELEQAGKLKALVTQNIDGLHQKAGSRAVFELHGHMRTATCLNCERQVPATVFYEQVRNGSIAYCSCGGLFKLDVVLFDEGLPRGLFWLAQDAFERCDLVIVAGTALEVAPVCDLPLTALNRGARLIIVNKSETYLDSRADVVLHDDVAEALPAIVKAALAA